MPGSGALPAGASLAHHVGERAAGGMAASQPGRVRGAGAHAGAELLDHLAAAQARGLGSDPPQGLQDVLADRYLAADVRIDHGPAQAVTAGLEAVVAVDDVGIAGRLERPLVEVPGGEGLRVRGEKRRAAHRERRVADADLDGAVFGLGANVPV